MNKYWPQTYIDVVGLTMVRSESYLIHIFSDGFSCKACGCIVHGEKSHEHFQAHMRELDAYLTVKQEENRVENTEGFYPNPCESCGKEIPRTGKPGRPPRVHIACKGQPPSAEEAAIIAELGL